MLLVLEQCSIAMLFTMLSNNFVLLAMPQLRFKMLSSCITMFSMLYNIVYNVSCSPSPAPGQALLGFHKNRCRSNTARPQRRSRHTSSSGAAISQHAVMSRIVHCNGGPRRVDVPSKMLQDRPGIKRAIQRARPGMKRARPARSPASSARGPASSTRGLATQRAALHESRAARHPAHTV